MLEQSARTKEAVAVSVPAFFEYLRASDATRQLGTELSTTHEARTRASQPAAEQPGIAQ
jgi:hypothetical protein